MRPQQEYMVLVSPDRLVMLMERTGDGREISVRELAATAGCHPSKIDALRNGRRKNSLYREAAAIAKRLGVDLLVLWAHPGRTVEAPTEHDHLTAVSA